MTNKEKTVAKTEKMQRRVDAGKLSKRFPEVAGLVITMSYAQDGMSNIQISRTFHFSPTSYAYFTVECLSKGCLDGGFDLDNTISSLIRGRRKTGEGTLCCDGSSLPPKHATINYKVEIEYASS